MNNQIQQINNANNFTNINYNINDDIKTQTRNNNIFI